MGLNPTRILPALLTLSLAGFLSAAPQLRLSQTTVGPVSVAVGANAPAAVIDALNAGDGNLNLSVSSAAPWIVPTVGTMRACPLGGDRCIPISMELRTASLQRGTHTGVVTVSDPGAVDAPQTVTVTVQVGGAPFPERIELFAPPNGTAEVSARTSSALQSATTTQSGGQWLAVATDGLVGSFRTGQTVLYRVIGNAQGLGESTHNGQVTFSGSTIPTENRAVPVTFRVTSQPIAQITPERLTFRVAANAAQQTQFLSVGNRGQGTLSLTGATAAAASGTWLSAERVAGQDLVAVRANPAGLAAGSYQGTVTVASNAVQGALTIPVQLDVIAPGPPVAFYQGVVNNATFEASDILGQGAIVAVFGEQFTTGEAQAAQSLPLGNEIGGVRVFVNDQPAPVYYVSYNQINFQIPYNATPGEATIRVERGSDRGNSISARIARSAPRLLRLGIRDYGIIVNQDGSFPIAPTPGVNSRPAKAGETLVIYAIGVGPTDPAVTSGVAAPSSPLARSPGDYRVTFGFTGPFGSGSSEVSPLFVGLTPGFVGLYQINVTIPADTPTGDAVPIGLIGPDGISNRVTIAIE